MMEVDDDNDCNYEYVTLTCCWLTIDSNSVSTPVNLKVAFYDGCTEDQQTVLKLCAAINTENSVASGVYEGIVNRNQAIKESVSTQINVNTESKITDNESVRIWLQGARSAIIGDNIISNDGKNTAKDSNKYACYLQHVKSEKPLQQQLLLIWKEILQPFGKVILGSVTVTLVPIENEKLIGQMNALFVQPLINTLAAERKFHRENNYLTSEKEAKLIEDNRRLLDQLKSVAESRKRDDQRVMAQFLKILNTKKQRLATIKQELSDLKQQHQSNMIMEDNKMEEEQALISDKSQQKSRGRVGRGRNGRNKTCRINVLDKEPLENNQMLTQKRKQNISTHSYNNEWFSTSSEKKKQKANILTLLQQTNEDQNQEPEQVKKKDINNVFPVDNAMVGVKEVLPTPVGIFEADTLVDDITSDKSPPWLQQEVPIPTLVSVAPSPLPHQSPNNDNSHQRSKNNAAWEKLWSGIV